MPFITLIHELGHIFFINIFNSNYKFLILGQGNLLFKYKKLIIKKFYFFYGSTLWNIDNLSKVKQIIVLLGGILFNILFLFLINNLIDITLISYYIKPLKTFCIFSILMSIFPLKYPNGNLSDGYQIYKILKS